MQPQRDRPLDEPLAVRCMHTALAGDPAFAKAMMGAGNDLPRSGKVFVSVRDEDKRLILPLVDRIAEWMGGLRDGSVQARIGLVDDAGDPLPNLFTLLTQGRESSVAGRSGSARSDADRVVVLITVRVSCLGLNFCCMRSSWARQYGHTTITASGSDCLILSSFVLV